ncbi:Short-chain dehydrogenase TIC 32, chloroplastic [Cyberlindnera fabianii]|uniref:Short-chain dehydrogenase TIC 32, chloroplastic n=1 Tax=Cyberlindnera fabianii TaxID=36022 RepID=A0A1V2L9B0_CYBFA|nr:Short-chain dehydrogenase TIC 32, chloroplastic [Cyberlindnera fabianii]
MEFIDTLKECIHDFWPAAPQFTPKDYPDLTGKYVLVTGTSAGIGYETAKLLLLKNATVVMANRNKTKTESTVDRMKHELIEDNSNLTSEDLDNRIITVYIDLSDLTTIKSGIVGLNDKIPHLDITIFNAGVMLPPPNSLTKQGYELQFGANVVGHHCLLKFLDPLILKAANPRVVFLTSLAHRGSPSNGGLTWDFRANDAKRVNSVASYGQSKVSTLYQSYIYGQKYKDQGVISLPVHPGLLQSELWRDVPSLVRTIAFLFISPPVYGAYTELFAALDPNITTKDSGRYIGPWGVFRPIRSDIEKGCTDGTAQKLWDYLDDAVKEYL